MDETIRRDNSGDNYTPQASKRADLDRNDEILSLFPRRERETQPLTKREREERWPIG
jgi:hypothetical protein